MVERAPSGFPARTASHEQDVQSQRRSAFERLGPNESQNRERKRAKSNVQEKKGAEHLTTHHLDSFQEQIIIGRKKELSQSTEKLGHMIGSHVFQDDSLQYGCLTSSNHQTTPSMMGRPSQNSGSEFTHNQSN
jgi:hypothetical protein